MDARLCTAEAMPSFNIPPLPEALALDRRDRYGSYIMCTANGRFGDLSNHFKS